MQIGMVTFFNAKTSKCTINANKVYKKVKRVMKQELGGVLI